jgi:hypothetical protein
VRRLLPVSSLGSYGDAALETFRICDQSNPGVEVVHCPDSKCFVGVAAPYICAVPVRSSDPEVVLVEVNWDSNPAKILGSQLRSVRL